MPSESHMNVPQSIWQNQTTEPFKMSAIEIRRKVQQRRWKARLEALFSIAGGLFLALVFGQAFFTRTHEFVSRLGWGLLTVWSIYFAYQTYRWILPGRLEPDAALNTTLQSYRSELEKRRDFGRRISRSAGLPFCFLGIALVIAPTLIQSIETPRLLVNVVPVFVLLAIWLAALFPARRRKRRQLQQEIEELRGFEAGSRS